MLRIVLASAVMAIFLDHFSGDVQQWMEVGTALRIFWMAKLIVGGAALYFAALWVAGLRPVHLKH